MMALALLVAAGCSHKREGEADMELTAEDVEWVEEEAVGPEASGKPWTRNIGRYDELFNDSNYLQYRSAERLGVDPMYTLYDTYNTRRPLVKIETGENYAVDNLTHSMPYLVPEAAGLLEEIGEEFGALLEARGGDRSNNKLLVTSMLRTPHTVRRLRRVNRNAVDSSTHMFGTTFDISWSNFYYPDSSKREDPVVLKGILAEVLLQKRSEGKCLVKFEKKTPCFHITVSR